MNIGHLWITNFATYDLRPATLAGNVWLMDKGVEGMGMPEIDRQTRETPLLDGQVQVGWRARPREVFWPLGISDGTAGSWSTLQGDFWRALRPGIQGTWRVTGPTGEVRDLLCRYVSDGGGVYARDPAREEFETAGVTLVADDPWWRGAAVSKTFQTAETPVPFFDTGSVVLNIMSANTVASTTIDNFGDIPAWPVYRIDGPITGFTINTLNAVVNVGVGQWLIIDTDPTKQTSLLYTAPGVFTNVTSSLNGVGFSPIPPGSSQSIDVVLNGSGSLTVTLRPGYYRAF